MNRSIFPFLLLFLVTMPVAAFAEQALVPQSGQTLCYDAAGVDIPCTGTGQDGDQQMGIPWPNPRFRDNSNGTITDNLTGLIWRQNARCVSARNWLQALSHANDLANGACGLTDGSVAGDWRLPNRKELLSLTNQRQGNLPAWLGTFGFLNVAELSYWSSSTSSTDLNQAWTVSSGANGGSASKNNKGDSKWVWAVRGGQ